MTRALSGGCRYSPTISRTFSTNSGSADSLNVSVRCGCRPKARQMRCTVLRLTPLVCAMARVLQWVAWVGVVSRVWVTIRSTAASVTVRGAPGRGSSNSPSRRWVTKRCRHLQTVCGGVSTASRFLVRSSSTSTGLSVVQFAWCPPFVPRGHQRCTTYSTDFRDRTLVDAIRCPRTPANRWSEQLGRFSDHMSKGLYSWAYNCRPATLGQLQEYLDFKRQEFYLDGPNDVDWIFRNDILQRREEALYVDYVETGEGHAWLDPARYHWDDRPIPTASALPSLLVSQALARAGMSDPDGLAVLANVWRALPMSFDLHWMDVRDINRKTLVEMEKKGALRGQPQEIDDRIIDRWQFPMYDIDLSKIPVSKEALRDRQRNWVP